MPLTSSLEEVLSQRPFPPSTSLDTNRCKWRAAQEAFGRRLAAWYTLINRCFVAHSGTTPIIVEEGDILVTTLCNFPLLYDMTGTWRVPNQVTSSVSLDSCCRSSFSSVSNFCDHVGLLFLVVSLRLSAFVSSYGVR